VECVVVHLLPDSVENVRIDGAAGEPGPKASKGVRDGRRDVEKVGLTRGVVAD
jgi:hypothetical protein